MENRFGIVQFPIRRVLGVIEATVSYTHLDVYKRQLQDFAGIGIGLLDDKSIQRDILEGDGFVFAALDVDPVSYTHLDVYKRQ